MKRNKICYWNDGRPVLDVGGVLTVCPPAVCKDNWRIWCRRHNVAFYEWMPEYMSEAFSESFKASVSRR